MFTPQSLHHAFCRPCSHIPVPPQSLQRYFCLPCGHFFLTRSLFFEAFFDPSDPSEPVLSSEPVFVSGVNSFSSLAFARLPPRFFAFAFSGAGDPAFSGDPAFCIGGSVAESPGSRSRSIAASATSRSNASAAADAAGIARRHSVSSCAHASESPCAATRYMSARLAVDASTAGIEPSTSSSTSEPPSSDVVPHASNMNAVTSAAAYVCSAAAATPTPSLAASPLIAPIASLHARAATAAVAAGGAASCAAE